MNSTLDPVDRTGSSWAWGVAAVGYLYYLTPLAAALVAGHPLAPLVTVGLIVPGALALLALRWRRRYPLAVALACAALLSLSPSPLGPAIVAQQSLARRHPGRFAIPAAAVAMLAGKSIELAATGYGWERTSIQVEAALAVGGVTIATLIGLLRSSRGEARASHADAEAARLEAEAARLNEARLAERERIAREMHDVVAHRISLVAMHSGALAHRTDLPPDDLREAARLIQTNAQASLDELRSMLATLRGSDRPPEPPQPTLAELAVLVADAEDAGQRVIVTGSGNLLEVPPRVSRQAFRIVQEGLTNARKHAPGAPVSIDVTTDAHTLRIRARNPLADLATPDTSGSGLGLIGIRERAALAGGVVAYGIRDGAFVVEVALPLSLTPPVAGQEAS